MKILFRIILILYCIFILWVFTINPASAVVLGIITAILAAPYVLFVRWVWKECEKSKKFNGRK